MAVRTVPDDLDRYEFHDERSDKYWLIQQDGDLVITWYNACGREPRDGIPRSKGTVPQAEKFAQSKIRQKLQEGYAIAGKGLPEISSEPKEKRPRIELKFIPFSEFKENGGNGIWNLTAPDGLLTIKGSESLEAKSDDIKEQFEYLRLEKCFPSGGAGDPPLASAEECFGSTDTGSCQFLGITGEGISLGYWSAIFGGNQREWLLLKIESGYDLIANGEDHFLEWGGTGTAEEGEYEPDENEVKETERFLLQVRKVRFPDDEIEE